MYLFLSQLGRKIPVNAQINILTRVQENWIRCYFRATYKPFTLILNMIYINYFSEQRGYEVLKNRQILPILIKDLNIPEYSETIFALVFSSWSNRFYFWGPAYIYLMIFFKWTSVVSSNLNCLYYLWLFFGLTLHLYRSKCLAFKSFPSPPPENHFFTTFF